MYMNYLSKPILYKVLLVIAVASFLSMATSFFLPQENLSPKAVSNNQVKASFNVAKAFQLELVQQKVSQTNVKKESSGAYLLKDFYLNGIFLDAENSLVIIKDSQSGIILRKNESHLDYTLVEIYGKKAKFKKGIHFYWSFLDPEDEKTFQESEALPSSDAGVLTAMRQTVARPMFEEIKFKDGQYYIPKEMLSNSAEMSKHFMTAGAQIYNINGNISFKITYVAPGSVFSKLGIQKNDFIIQANGESFKSVNDPIKFFQNIKNVKNVSLTVKRGNQTQELKYEVY